MLELATLGQWKGRPAWDVALAAFGVSYRFARQVEEEDGVTRYRLNDTNFLPDQPVAGCAYGFRFLALSTPRITEGGPALARLQTFVEQRRKSAKDAGSTDDDEKDLTPGDIRPLGLIADWDSTGVDRYGVLRMDVDNLGRLFHWRLEFRSLLHTAALSGAFTRFFEGWLNTICDEVAESWQQDMVTITNDAGDGGWRKRMCVAPEEQTPRCKQPYVIYAGGDDLLVVGPWDVLPPLAARIRRDMASYALRGYVAADPLSAPSPVTLSAGIAADSVLFPLYQAADRAGDALKSAKQRRQRSARGGVVEWEIVKDAITLLGVTVSWEEFAQAEQLAHTLARLIDLGEIAEVRQKADKAPHALIQMLASVARSYAESGGEASEERLAYGRWMPLLAYGLRRMADRVPSSNDELRQQILGLAGEALDLTRVAGAARWNTMCFLALPVRWAELLIRTGG